MENHLMRWLPREYLYRYVSINIKWHVICKAQFVLFNPMVISIFNFWDFKICRCFLLWSRNRIELARSCSRSHFFLHLFHLSLSLSSSTRHLPHYNMVLITFHYRTFPEWCQCSYARYNLNGNMWIQAKCIANSAAFIGFIRKGHVISVFPIRVASIGGSTHRIEDSGNETEIAKNAYHNCEKWHFFLQSNVGLAS